MLEGFIELRGFGAELLLIPVSSLLGWILVLYVISRVYWVAVRVTTPSVAERPVTLAALRSLQPEEDVPVAEFRDFFTAIMFTGAIPLVLRGAILVIDLMGVDVPRVNASELTPIILGPWWLVATYAAVRGVLYHRRLLYAVFVFLLPYVLAFVLFASYILITL